MEETTNKFKIVYCRDVSTYTIWVTDDQGKWKCKDAMNTFTNKGEIVEGKCDDWCMVSEKLLWIIDYWNTLGYRFSGIVDSREGE